MTASIFVIMSVNNPFSRFFFLPLPPLLSRYLHLTLPPHRHTPEISGQPVRRRLPIIFLLFAGERSSSSTLSSSNTGDEHNPRPPHSNVHGSYTEIETIYRCYQVLLLNPLRT